MWAAFGLQPHRSQTFKLSNNSLFVDKVRDIVGLYLSPPNRAPISNRQGRCTSSQNSGGGVRAKVLQQVAYSLYLSHWLVLSFIGKVAAWFQAHPSLLS